MITATELREKYFEFFKEKGHALIPSASLIPENDPTVLFTTAGMHPLVPYLMGEKHPEGTRLVDVQKCVRTGDIDDVGDNTHLTFFEMLGNWSLGDYFKKESIAWSWEFLTDKKWLGIDPNRLFVTVYEGDEEVAKDEESIKIWQECFKKADIEAVVCDNGATPPNPPLARGGTRIFPLGKEDNWWGPAGKTGPCGPDTEIFYDVAKDACSDACKPGCSCGKYVEIWNNVFMEFNKKDDGTYEPLSQKNVDTGMGVERTVTILNGSDCVFEMDTLKPIQEKVRELSNMQNEQSERVITDHIRSAVMIISDGAVPSNLDQGYVVRKLIRRAIRHGRLIGIKDMFCAKIAEKVIEIMGSQYPDVQNKKDSIIQELNQEEEKFTKTLERGLKQFKDLVSKEGMSDQVISGKDAFDLFQSFGFPLEMTKELAKEQNLSVDDKEFYEEFNKHQELSRTATEGRFKGGLADNSEMTTKYHTATHLLHAALRKVLGEHVQQKGSNITAERLRFDFSHGEKMTEEEIRQVEDFVNNAIAADLSVSCEEMSVSEAKAQGAMGLFESKYGDKVKLYSIGDISKEICGGPHVERTGDMGHFKITKEQASSAGVRRIKAVLE
ncbi:MAG: alanine--tRNA ligase [Parcubacteria group bacterium CG11_big_fil_rev_8_21_14_0_20_41_14]|nr:MAG: alanine--tRNA ligase [Parcubacteria group bacterium CG22_combo_CG10-13_8_21_14_all_41_9]PIQ80400.1 MAG: alanine--tRNA ligase [Parcubacteria group bacterium CG11_big_fil_rev_8_21_14_0_20_41_14]